MTRVIDYLQNVNHKDRQFIGTIAFRSEEISLPDGTKMALGIDDGHWVLIYQQGSTFKVFKYDQAEQRIMVDEKVGNQVDLQEFKKHVNFFMEHALVEDLVTLMPPQ